MLHEPPLPISSLFSGSMVPPCDVARVSTENTFELGYLFAFDFKEVWRNPSPNTGTISTSAELSDKGLSS